jgi:hypothetical protein
MATFDPTSLQVKRGKGKNFCVEKKRQLVLSFLLISQHPVCGNGQQSVAFWQCIVDHSNKHKHVEGTKWPTCNLETKWGAIKHDVAKFCWVLQFYTCFKQIWDYLGGCSFKSFGALQAQAPKECFIFVFALLAFAKGGASINKFHGRK